MTGSGTQADPWDLATALASPKVKPGHTIHMAAGTYAGDFTSTLEGTEAAPITLKPVAGARAVIDGSLTINGQDTDWREIEVAYSGWTTRETEETGSNPSDIPTNKSVTIRGPRTKFVNGVVHDLAQGFGFWVEAVDAEIYGCVIFNNGWDAPDRPHGHSIYTQNLSGTKRIARNVMPASYSDYSLHAYTEGGSIQGFEINENVSAGKTLLVGGYTPVARLVERGNMLYGGALRLGYGPEVVNEDAALTDNVLGGGAIRQTGNFTDLVETGTVTEPGDRVFILPNAYDPLRALVVIYNAALADTVSVDLSGLSLPAGDYRLRNTANYLAEWHAFAYAGGAVDVPMTGWTVAVPVGAVAPLVESTMPAFGTFILEPA